MKYRIKKDTPFNRAVSKAKKRRIKYTFGSLITVITILGFFVNSPVFQVAILPIGSSRTRKCSTI
jgi:hypothetical protein